MAFLDNSGDIILDAVLTDTGRFRLARGDGSFKITKFALGDDEINYANYNKNHASGSAYFDLDILQTPVLEAFTNNTSTMKSKLVTISRTNLLYMPILKLNTQEVQRKDFGLIANSFLVAVDRDTLQASVSAGQDLKEGVVNGTSLTDTYTGGYIRVDQGLDTTEISPGYQIDQDLYETQYMIEMDDRLGQLAVGDHVNNVGGRVETYSFLDDDNIASYYVSDSNANLVKNNSSTGIAYENTGTNSAPGEVIRGPRGTFLQFGIKAKLELQTSTHLFTKFGSVDNNNIMGLGNTVKYIDTTVRVTGVTTGYRIDIPIRYIKKP